jgi:hypothetical protein
VDSASTRLPANSQPKNKNAIRTGRSARITAPLSRRSPALNLNTKPARPFLFKTRPLPAPQHLIIMPAVVLSQPASHHRLGPDSARVQLRNALTTYLHSQAPPAPAGYHRWNTPSSSPANTSSSPPRLLVGDPVVLAVSPVPPPSKQVNP